MKAFKLILILIVGGVVLNSCTKDPDQIPERKQDYNNAIDTRSNANLLADSIWQKPSVSRLNLLWAQMMEEATVDEIGTFIYNNGLFDWKLAKVVKEFEPEHYILSVPTLKHDSLQSILFVAVNNGAYSFFHITKDQLQADTEVLLEQFGAGNLIIPIFSFFQYSQVLGSRRAFDFLYTHLIHPEVADEILEIIPRGWCLIEIELYTENQSHEDVDENCNCTYVNQLTGHEIMNPPSGVHPSVFDPTWFNNSIQQHKWRINYLNNDGTVIHGSPGESGTTVYQFWAWCEDEVGQDPWAHSWATNLEPTGGGGGPINTGPDWSYNKPRWDENTMECMFAFNHPHSTAMINQLEEALLTASCGEAAEYNIKSIIDNIVMGLCNEYYDNQEAQGGEFPQFPTSPPHDIHETLEAITLGVEGSSYYQIGQQICEVCDNALNPGQCYDAVNNCGTEGYEACVEEVLCGYAISSFSNIYDLTLTPQQTADIQSIVFSCGGNGFEGEALLFLIENNDWPDPFVFFLIQKYISRKWNNRNSPYNQANNCEKELMADHPLCASHLAGNWISVNLLTKYHIGENSQNGCSDAFRHAFFNALNAVMCGSVGLARDFGVAHECLTDSQMAKEMDLHNNEIGYSIIENNPDIVTLLSSTNFNFYHMGLNQLIEELCNSLSNGEMKIFSNPSGSDPDLDPNNSLILSNSCSCIN